VEELAEELGITPLTARTHLKRVFAKTGTTRQADLVSLLLSGPALLQLGTQRADGVPPLYRVT